MIRLLHIFPDAVFFDSTSDFFDHIDVLENHYIFYTSKKDHEFKYIKNTQKIEIINCRQKLYNLLSNDKFNGVVFHSLHPKNYNLFKYIDKTKVIIWWMWGYDVYSKYRFLPPLIDIDLFKPNTKKFIKNNPPERLPKRLLRKLYWIGRMPFDYFIRKNAISRINYFIPVLSIEYKLISKSYFRSKLFYKSGPGFRNSQQIYYSNTPGNILIGNSLSYTNNHLDIFELVKDMPIKGRKFIIPISYGEDYNKNIKKLQDISRLSVENTIWLKDFMPYEKYNDLMTTVTHAIMGHMRQQAIGNIFSCLRKGIKLYLFKDSITYNFLKEKGFIIFTIENDLSLSSLSEVLSEDDAIHNYNLLEEKDDRLEKYRERFIEIFNNNDIQRYC